MQRSDFYFDLPEHLVAQEPLAERSTSRMLRLEKASGSVVDLQFTDLPAQLRAGDLLVFNDTKVIPARLWGHKRSGGKVEILVERITGSHTALAQVRASKSPKAGGIIDLGEATAWTVTGRQGDFYSLHSGAEPVLAVLERLGHTPLPPYIRRPDTAADQSRYQTVYARNPGAVAAPTAGLHFDEALLEQLAAAEVRTAWLTLHVGAGTFQPVRVDDISEHRMHSEWLEVPEATCTAVADCKARGGRVIAVGTTAVRSLESAAAGGTLAAYAGESDIFIYPGYEFRVVDALVTNFHLPESTLIMLVSALGGHTAVMAAYRHAVASGYRFFSYGDAMLVI